MECGCAVFRLARAERSAGGARERAAVYVPRRGMRRERNATSDDNKPVFSLSPGGDLVSARTVGGETNDVCQNMSETHLSASVSLLLISVWYRGSFPRALWHVLWKLTEVFKELRVSCVDIGKSWDVSVFCLCHEVTLKAFPVQASDAVVAYKLTGTWRLKLDEQNLRSCALLGNDSCPT